MSGQSAETGWNGPIRAVRTPGNRPGRRENSFCACSHAARTARRKDRRPGARNAQYAAEPQRRHRERRVHRHRPQPGIFAPRPRPRRAQGPGPSRRRRAREPPALQSPEGIRHRSTPRNALKDTGLGGVRASPIYMCVLCHMGPSMNCMRFACRPSIGVDRSSSSVRCNAIFPANGRRLKPSSTSHAGNAMRPLNAFSPYPGWPVTRLKYHPVPVRTVARTRFANRLVSTMSDAENLLKCLPNHNSGHLRAPRAGVFFVSRVPKQGVFVYSVPKSAEIWY